MIGTCKRCKFYRIGSQECTQEDFVRENLIDVSDLGGMMVDIMMESGTLDTFGTPPDYRCGYFEEDDATNKTTLP